MSRSPSRRSSQSPEYATRATFKENIYPDDEITIKTNHGNMVMFSAGTYLAGHKYSHIVVHQQHSTNKKGKGPQKQFIIPIEYIVSYDRSYNTRRYDRTYQDLKNNPAF